MKLSIIIPTYNEKDTILQLIKKVSSLDIDKQIIIVDDNSTDGTQDLLRGISIKNSEILYHEKNKGKGSAIRTGMQVATGDYLVIQDADLEYDPQDLVRMFQIVQEKKLKVLFGSRRLNKENVQHSGVMYYLGGWVVTFITNILFNQKLTDEPTCYKMFRADFIKALPLKCRGFEFCPEVTALTALKGVTILEVPISYYPRNKKEGKKIKFRDGFEAIWVLIKYRFFSKTNKGV